MRLYGLLALFLASMVLFTGCSSESTYPVESYVHGTLKVRAEVDSTGNYEGFRITVLTQKLGEVDTLGTAVTDKAGAFSMVVHAPEKGIYPIVVERSGTNLSVDDIVLSSGDSIQVTGAYPLGARGLRIISTENAAWSAYRNAKAGHNQQMVGLLKGEGYSTDDLKRINAQTSTILWSIPSTYPGTIGGNLSMAESVVMMEGWSDSTVIARYEQIPLDNQSIVEVVRAARRSVSRAVGLDSAIALIDHYIAIIPESKRPGLMAEKVIAYADSMMNPEAIRTATELKKAYPESEWADWAGRATYELENLQPGMIAPAIKLVNRDGEEISTATVKGKFVILEFFDPSEQIYQREFESRNGIAAALDDRAFQYISISVEPDSVINEALFDEENRPGHFVWLGTGMDAKVVKDFNVQILPTRFLLDPQGQIMAKYSGPSVANLEQDLASIVTGLNGLVPEPADNEN